MKISYEDKLLEIIKAFGESGILENVIIIGSWATYFYVQISDVQQYTNILIDETVYTDYLVYDEAESTGVNAVGTVISYVKLVSATAKHLTSDTYVVIMYA